MMLLDTYIQALSRLTDFREKDCFYVLTLQVIVKDGAIIGHRIIILKDFRNAPVIYSLSLPHG